MRTEHWIIHKEEEMDITVHWEQVREAVDTDRGTHYSDYYEAVEAENEKGELWEAGFDYPKDSWQHTFEQAYIEQEIEP